MGTAEELLDYARIFGNLSTDNVLAGRLRPIQSDDDWFSEFSEEHTTDAGSLVDRSIHDRIYKGLLGKSHKENSPISLLALGGQGKSHIFAAFKALTQTENTVRGWPRGIFGEHSPETRHRAVDYMRLGGRQPYAASQLIPSFTQVVLDQVRNSYEGNEEKGVATLIELLGDRESTELHTHLVVLSESMDITSLEQRSSLQALLLAFANDRLRSSDPLDGPAVRSAIRHYASMCAVAELNHLANFLEPPPTIDARLTTLMAIINVMRVEHCSDLATFDPLISRAREIASRVLSDHLVVFAEASALAANAVAALIAMGDDPNAFLVPSLRSVQNSSFRRIALQKLLALQADWESGEPRQEMSNLRLLKNMLNE